VEVLGNLKLRDRAISSSILRRDAKARMPSYGDDVAFRREVPDDELSIHHLERLLFLKDPQMGSFLSPLPRKRQAGRSLSVIYLFRMV